MEITHWKTYTEIGERVPILPMRHGNEDESGDSFSKSTRSDPTYEAWKSLSPSISRMTFYLLVPILPMRHGNDSLNDFHFFTSLLFRSYL